MYFDFPKSFNYHLEEGEYAMTLSSVTEGSLIKTGNCTCQNKVRIVFVDDSDPRALVQDAAGANFCLECHPEEFAKFLEDMLGTRLKTYLDDKGGINLDALSGVKVILTIRHVGGRTGRYAHPFCKIAAIRPADDSAPTTSVMPFSRN